MNLNDFNRASREECTAWLIQKGTLLASRKFQGNKVSLYRLGEFYAEVYYQVWDNQVYLVKGFRNKNLLRLYPDKVNLANI